MNLVIQIVVFFAVSSESLPFQPGIHQNLLPHSKNLNLFEKKMSVFKKDLNQKEDEPEGILQQFHEETSLGKRLELKKQTSSIPFDFERLEREDKQFSTPKDDGVDGGNNVPEFLTQTHEHIGTDILFSLALNKRIWPPTHVDSALRKLRIVDGSLQTLKNMLKSQSNQRGRSQTVARRRSSQAQLERLGKK